MQLTRSIAIMQVPMSIAICMRFYCNYVLCALLMFVDLFVAFMKVNVSVGIMPLEVSARLIQM